MLIDTFLAKFEGGAPEDCWEWGAYRARSGYGYINRDGIPTTAHRVSYELFVGPVPHGLHIDHLCRNRACVNPSHLEAVTPGENARRGEVATRTHCAAGHPYTPENTFTHPNGGRGCRICKRRHDANYRAKRQSC